VTACSQKRSDTTLVVGDLHCPFAHPGALDFLRDVAKEHRPYSVVCLGDEIDAHAWSRFEKNPKLPAASDELRKARKQLAGLAKLFPRMYVCHSNHTMRLYKKAASVGIPDECVKSIADVLGAPETWTWAHRWELNGVVFQHGDGYSGKEAHIKAAAANRRSTVIGHVHSHAGVAYLSGPLDTIWGMQAGCLLDPGSEAFEYAKNSPNRPTLGCGVVRDGVPHFVPMSSSH
jgi:hypothetical protein